MKSFHDFANVNLGAKPLEVRAALLQPFPNIRRERQLRPAGFRERKPAWRFCDCAFLALIAVLGPWLVLLPGRPQRWNRRSIPICRASGRSNPPDALKPSRSNRVFTSELAASEPLVADPIEMCFDENGRLFVVEMIDYSERRDEQPHPWAGFACWKIRMKMAISIRALFVRRTFPGRPLSFVMTAAFFVGGGTGPFLLQRTRTATAWRTRAGSCSPALASTGRLNMQAMFNSFRWGLDNRIHGATAPMGGTVISPLTPQQKAARLTRARLRV